MKSISIPRKKSLTRHFILSVLLIVTVLMSVILVMMNLLFTQSYDRQIVEEIVCTSDSISQAMTTFMDGAYDLSCELAVNPSILTMDGDIQTPILSDCAERNDYFELLYIQDINGDQTARSSGKLANRRARWWFLKMLEDEQPFVSESYYSVFTMKPCTSIYVPMYANGKNGDMIGIFASSIKLTYIQRIVEKFSNYENGKYSFVIDGKGVVTAHPDSSYLDILRNYKTQTMTFSVKDEDGNAIYDENGNVATEEKPFTISKEYQNVINRVMDGMSGNSMITQDGVTWYVSYSPILMPGYSESWSVITLYKKEMASAVVNLIIIKILTAAALISAATVIVLVLLARSVTEPIREITESVNKIAGGDYTTRITGNYQNEFAIVRDSVNMMADSIEAYVTNSDNSLNVLENIMDGLDAFIHVTVPETGEILFINERMRKHFGLAEDVFGEYCYKVLQKGQDKRCDFCPCYQLDKDPGSIVVWEEHNTVTNRDYRNTDCYIDWIDGVKVHLQHSVDITDLNSAMYDKLKAEREALELKHEKERAEETSHMKSIFLANMSHEIRTPMNGILGFSELALEDNISLKTKGYLQKIKTSAESLLQIINDILDISKIEAGKVELEKIPFSLSEIFKLCRIITSPRALEKGIELFCYVDPSIEKMLLGDPTRLRQILLNLLSNAVKFTNSGTVKLLSAVLENTDTSVTIHFEVKDTGIGMSSEQIRKIFRPFVQADDSTTRKYGGTGLGLAITKSIVELMGGELKVESTLGTGSNFSFDLTFETSDESADNIPNTKDITDMTEKPIFSGEVLVCEDNELNQQVITDHLLRVGLKTIIAANGRIGLEYAKRRIDAGEKPFDLIFMDIHMPEMDGLETAKRLVAMGNKTPIVALTANIMANDRETYISSGMSDCVPKPFTSNELLSCLTKYLKPIGFSRKSEVSVGVTDEMNTDTDEKQRVTLAESFIKSNRNTFGEIIDAVEAGDIKLAHRLAHTLKGVAGLVGMTELQKSAGIIEKALASGKAEFTDKQMNILKVDLEEALKELEYLVNMNKDSNKDESEVVTETADTEKILNLFSELDALLESDSFDCLGLTDRLSAIDGTELLIEQVENFNFKQARETLAEIRQELICGED